MSDIIRKAQSTLSTWNQVDRAEPVRKGDYTGHPFRGNKYVDEFGNSRTGLTFDTRNTRRSHKYKKLRRKLNALRDDLEAKAAAGDKGAKEQLDELIDDARYDEIWFHRGGIGRKEGESDESYERRVAAEERKAGIRKELIEKARRKKKDEGGPPYDPDFQGNQYVDEHGNPVSGRLDRDRHANPIRDVHGNPFIGSVPQRRGGKVKRSASAISRTVRRIIDLNKQFHGSGVKFAIDANGRPIMSVGHRKVGNFEYKRDPKTNIPQIRVKASEQIIQLTPGDKKAVSDLEDRLARETRRQRRREKAEKSDIHKGYRMATYRGLQASNRVRFAKGDKKGHQFRGNQWVTDTGYPRVGAALGVAGAVAGVGGAYRIANDKRIVNRRRDIFASVMNDDTLKAIRDVPTTHIPRSNVAAVLDDINNRRVGYRSKYGYNPTAPKTPRTHMEARWRNLDYRSQIPRRKADLQQVQDDIADYKKQVRDKATSEDAKKVFREKIKEAETREKQLRRILNKPEGVRPAHYYVDDVPSHINRMLARSVDTELQYIGTRARRIPDYAKRFAREKLSSLKRGRHVLGRIIRRGK